VLVPIVIGILVSYALDPVVSRLVQWRLPRVVASTAVFVAVIAALVSFSYPLTRQVDTIVDRLPGAAHELRAAIEAWKGGPGPVAKVQEAADELQKLSGAAAPPPNRQSRVTSAAAEHQPFDLGDYLWESSLSVTTFIADTVVVGVLTLYLLLSGDTFRRRFFEIAGPRLSQKKITLQILDAIATQISRYLFVRVLISIFVGFGTFVAFGAIGLEQPVAWAAAAGLLNVIPYLGAGVVAVAAGVAAFLQFHSLSMGALAAGLSTLVACVEAYFLTPWLTSRTGEMNATVVFIGLVFWGWLWGLPGLLLAVPIMMVIKAVSDHVDVLEPLATLLRQ
jgi:predicted PurR-regulated permease PerM